MRKCKDICQEYKLRGRRTYDNNGKRCRNCDIFMKYPGYRCPCCNHKLTLKPKANKGVQRWLKIRGIEGY